MFLIRSAVPTDAEELSQVAQETFRDGWADVIGEEFAEAYIAENLHKDRLRADIANPTGHYFALATLGETGGIIGYGKLDWGRPAHDSVTGPAPLLLQRFYISAAGRGRGVADLLLTFCEKEAARRGFGTLWIECDPRNKRAWKFYEKRRFVVKGATIYYFPNGYNDQVRILERAIVKES